MGNIGNLRVSPLYWLEKAVQWWDRMDNLTTIGVFTALLLAAIAALIFLPLK